MSLCYALSIYLNIFYFTATVILLGYEMLPSKGYFNDIECPYLENNCGRPYCHFNHRRKQQENSNEILLEECIPKEVPTYKPTPKSELAVRKSHIPISYIPDVYNIEKTSTRSFRSHAISDIIYKPTPISLLNSTVKTSVISDNLNNSLSTQQILESKYTPERLLEVVKNEENTSKSGNKYEYKPAEQEIEYNYNPTSQKDVNEESLSDIVYRPNSYSLNSISDLKYTPSSLSKQTSDINFENLDNEFEMIDEIINTSDVDQKSEVEKINENETTVSCRNSESVDESNINGLSPKIIDKHCIHEKVRSPSKPKHKEKSSHSRENTKQDKKDKKTDKKEIEKVKQLKNEAVNKAKKSEREKKEKNENRKHDKRKSESSRSRDRDKRSDHDRKNSKINAEEERNKNREKEKHKFKEGEDKKKDYKRNNKDKHSKHKTEKYEIDKKHDKRHSKSDTQKADSHKGISELDKPETIAENRVSSLIDFDMNFDIDEQQTMEECFKIFNEYKPSIAQNMNIVEENSTVKNESNTIEELTLSKKRIAHSNAQNLLPKIQPPKPNNKPTPGQVMNNRFKIIKAAQADNEENLIKKELNNIVKRPQACPLIRPAKRIKIDEVKHSQGSSNKSLIDEILNRTVSKPAAKKIAPVSNVMNIQKAKANLKLLNSRQEPQQSSKTIAQTNKAGKRQAHIPDYSLSDIPDVIDVDKSKLPVNVRSRFLTLLADECCKLYFTQKDAYKRALDEEYSCYQKCKVLVTYRNSAMLAVNRLRKELKEREEKNLGLIGSEETGQVNQGDSEKKSLYKKIHEYVLTNEELDIHGYPRESTIPGRAIIKNRKASSDIRLPKNQKKCCRCSKIYLIDDDGKAIYEEECLYHPLKKRTIRGQQIYLCCKSTDESGCVISHTHVSEAPDDAELEGFQTTLPPNSDKDPRNFSVYALDCEMCYTTKGLELTRVTVIDTNCKTVYESLVKPLNEIIDYNTRFSGITKDQMDRTSTGILQVQANILHLCNSKTILIGHSLESDMKALKIIHSTIVDTAVLFPHKMGLPHKRALKSLASDYLQKIIQNDIGGHDSAEDAITCMELIKWKVKEDTKTKS